MLDATRCLSYWTQVPEPIPEPYRAPLGAQVYGCDICQDVCPWNRGVERRRAGLGRPTQPRTSISLGWLDAERSLDDDLLRRLYVPRNDPRWLERNALVALGNTGAGVPRAARVLAQARRRRRRAARRACTLGARAAGGRMQLRGLERWISLLRLIAFPFVVRRGRVADYPPGAGSSGPGSRPARSSSASSRSSCSPEATSAPGIRSRRASPPRSSTRSIVIGYVMVFAFERGLPVQQILYIDLAAACVRFAISAGSILAAVSAPILAVFEKLRVDHLNRPYSWKLVAFQTGLEVLMALIVGWLVQRLAAEGARAEARAEEAERLHEAEQQTVAELRRLSTLRADFVSLVSHEVRTPMAAVIGSARTLQQRWRELTSEQRDAFLALIADETDRLAALVGEVLDSSRIDAGTFSYTFGEVDLAGLVNETVASAELARESVQIASTVAAGAPDRPRRSAAAAAGPHEPDRQRGQVLARRARRSRCGRRPSTAT